MKWLKDILTEKDNSTFEWAAVMGLLMVVGFVGMAIYDVVHNKKFDPVKYGTGGASLLGGGGLARFMKGKVGDNATPPPAS
jgi:hypothetical protein